MKSSSFKLLKENFSFIPKKLGKKHITTSFAVHRDASAKESTLEV